MREAKGEEGGGRIPIIKRSDGVQTKAFAFLLSLSFFLSFFFFLLERDARARAPEIGALLRVFVETCTFITRLIILVAGELSFFINLNASLDPNFSY